MTKYYVNIPDPAASRLRKACAKVQCFSDKKIVESITIPYAEAGWYPGYSR